MQYNTQQKRMPLPEYGRSIQNMVDHALTIEDRSERQRCANTIINIMGNMFPHLRDVPDFKHKLWDHPQRKFENQTGKQSLNPVQKYVTATTAVLWKY